jgi:MoxR-like ATPase
MRLQADPEKTGQSRVMVGRDREIQTVVQNMLRNIHTLVFGVAGLGRGPFYRQSMTAFA